MESSVITDDEEAALRIIAEALVDPSATANPGSDNKTGQRRSQDGEIISKSKGRRRPKAAKPRTSRTSKAPQSGFKGVYSSNFLKPGEQKWQARGEIRRRGSRTKIYTALHGMRTQHRNTQTPTRSSKGHFVHARVRA